MVGRRSTWRSSDSIYGFSGVAVLVTMIAGPACDGLFHRPDHPTDRRAGVENRLCINHFLEAMQAFLDVFQVVRVFGRMPQAVVEQHGGARFDEEGCISRFLGLISANVVPVVEGKVHREHTLQLPLVASALLMKTRQS